MIRDEWQITNIREGREGSGKVILQTLPVEMIDFIDILRD